MKKQLAARVAAQQQAIFRAAALAKATLTGESETSRLPWSPPQRWPRLRQPIPTAAR
ncbi:MAG: hypothetical protein WKG07_34395 [Hymenobacter sp.]